MTCCHRKHKQTQFLKCVSNGKTLSRSRQACWALVSVSEAVLNRRSMLQLRSPRETFNMGAWQKAVTQCIKTSHGERLQAKQLTVSEFMGKILQSHRKHVNLFQQGQSGADGRRNRHTSKRTFREFWRRGTKFQKSVLANRVWMPCGPNLLFCMALRSKLHTEKPTVMHRHGAWGTGLVSQQWKKQL